MSRSLAHAQIEAVSPAASMNLWFQMATIAVEAQMVIAMRMAGMAGMVPAAPGENNRMVMEKVAAAQESMMAAGRQVMLGATGPAVMAAALKPIGRRTKANARRLTTPRIR